MPRHPDRDFSISRVTLFSFLLTLLLAGGIQVGYTGPKDDCSLYPASDTTATEYVVIGPRTVEIQCSNWLARMPDTVKFLWLVVLGLGAVCLLNAVGDLQDWLKRRRQEKTVSKGWP